MSVPLITSWLTSFEVGRVSGHFSSPFMEATYIVFVTRNFFSGAAGHDLPSAPKLSKNTLLHKADHSLAHHSL
jgi:hypothetical protein